ncbi:hypothetical protein D3C71_2186300 [compost metagenome]
MQMLPEADGNPHEGKPDQEQQRHFLRPKKYKVEQLAGDNLYDDNQNHGQQPHLGNRLKKRICGQSKSS